MKLAHNHMANTLSQVTEGLLLLNLGSKSNPFDHKKLISSVKERPQGLCSSILESDKLSGEDQIF